MFDSGNIYYDYIVTRKFRAKSPFRIQQWVRNGVLSGVQAISGIFSDTVPGFHNRNLSNGMVHGANMNIRELAGVTYTLLLNSRMGA
ncbi:MAG: hypothetical protein ACYCY5_04945 [Sulfuricella sp.]